MRPIFTLIDTRHWYVIANFRETDLKNIRSGTPATIRLMSDSGKTFEGKVDLIGYGVLPDDGGLVLGGLPKFLALLTGSALPSVFRSKSWSINLTRNVPHRRFGSR